MIIFLLILFAFISPVPLYSQSDKISFERVSYDLNRTHNSIHSIFQDSRGFIWIGSKSGLDLFNGNSFQNYKTKSADNSLSDDWVKFIFEDRERDLWIGTRTFLNKFIRGSEKFIHFRPDNKNPNSICGENIIGIIQDNNGFLWIATSNGLSRYDKNRNIFFKYYHYPGDHRSISSNSINAIYLDSHGYLWLGYSTGGLDRIDISNSLSDSLLVSNNKLIINHINLTSNNININIQNQINRIYETRDGKFWICTEGAGIFKFVLPSKGLRSENNNIFVEEYVVLNTSNKVNRLSNNIVKDILEDKSGNVWIATFGGGINVISNDNKMNYFQYDPYNNSSLGNNSIQKLFEDKTGNIWIGPLTGGLNKYSPKRYDFKIYRSDLAHGNLKSDLITAIYQDDDNILWLGTRNGLNRFDRKKNSCEVFYQDQNNTLSVTEKVIRSVYEDKNKKIWVGAIKGLYCFDKSKKQFIDYDQKLKSFLSNSNVRALRCDKSGLLWIGTNNGLIKFNTKSSEYQIFVKDSSNPSTLCYNYIWSIYEDRYSNLWIGTKNGLSRYIREKNIFVNYYFKEYLKKDDKKFYDDVNLITSITEDLDGNIWTDSYSGLNNVIRTNKPLSDADAYKINDVNFHYLKDQQLSGILVDEKNNLWVGSDIGIFKIKSDRDKYRLYDVKDGATANELNAGSCFKSKNNEFYFGGNNGLLSFTPSKFVENERIPDIALTSVKILNNVIYTGTTASEIKQIDLSYTDRILTFSFAALDYTATDKNQYKYMLEGFDKEWIDYGNKTDVTYMNLRGGDYTFRVIGANNDNIWNTEGLSIKVSVTPPYWERLWFQILIFVFITLILFSYFVMRIRRIEKQRNLLENEVELRTEDLYKTNIKLGQEIQVRKKAEEEIIKTNDLLTESNATKDKLFSIIAHDLRGPVGNLVSMLNILRDEDETDEIDKAEFLISTIDSAESTYLMLENLLDWARTQKDGINLKIEKIQLSSIIEEVISFLTGIATKKSISLVSNVDENLFASCDRNTISTVVRNLVSNALKFTPERGIIQINASEDNGKILVSVRDTGVGMKEKALKEMFENDKVVSTKGTGGEKGTGLGIILCIDFVKKNGGDIWAESKIGEGTVFYFNLSKAV